METKHPAPGLRPRPVCVTSWTANLKVGFTYKRYDIEVKIRPCNNHDDEQQIDVLVNNERIDDSMFSASEGASEWEQDGHYFQLTSNPLLCFCDSLAFKEYRLFIDGFDVETGTEFTAFWRGKIKKLFFIGLRLLILASGFSYFVNEDVFIMMSDLLICVLFFALVYVFGVIFLRIHKGKARKQSPAQFTVDDRDIMTV